MQIKKELRLYIIGSMLISIFLIIFIYKFIGYIKPNKRNKSSYKEKSVVLDKDLKLKINNWVIAKLEIDKMIEKVEILKQKGISKDSIDKIIINEKKNIIKHHGFRNLDEFDSVFYIIVNNKKNKYIDSLLIINKIKIIK